MKSVGVVDVSERNAADQARMAAEKDSEAGGTVVEVKKFKLWTRVSGNLGESAPYALLFFLLQYVFRANETASIILLCTYMGFRILHYLCFVFDKQPWRTICWLSSIMMMIAAAINAICGSLDLN